jgi:hypothetical protein
MCSVLEPGRTEWDGSIPRAWNGSDPVFGSEKFEEWDGSIFCSVESMRNGMAPAAAPLACSQPPPRSPATSRRPARLQPAAAPLACSQPPPACNLPSPRAPATTHRPASLRGRGRAGPPERERERAPPERERERARRREGAAAGRSMGERGRDRIGFGQWGRACG